MSSSKKSGKGQPFPLIRRLEKGLEKGMKKGKETVAKNMLSLGIEDELIIKATGLDQSIIDKLKKSLSLPTQ